jgi:CDP-diacylglycerol--serine O-phosphatidyltransferase
MNFLYIRSSMAIKKHIPNIITSGNLFCGCMATVFAFQGNLVWAAYLVAIALILDFFDGFAARMLGVSGEMGKQLDSLADMVTFGLVPGVVVYQMLSIWVIKQTVTNFDFVAALQGDIKTNPTWMFVLPFTGFILTIFSAIRLAKFNIDIRQKDSFIGIPTPANAILVCSLPLILDLKSIGLLSGNNSLNANLGLNFGELWKSGNLLGGMFEGNAIHNFILNPWFLISLTLVMSYLMVAELPLFALKFKSFKWGPNKMRYSFLLTSGLLLIIFRYMGIPIIILLYVLLSIINNFLNKYRNEVQG